MIYTNFSYKYLYQTAITINKLHQKGFQIFRVKNIRKLNGIASDDKSKINFIWRSLDILEEEGFIKSISINPKKYEILKLIPLYDFFSNLFKKESQPKQLLKSFYDWERQFK